MYPFICGGGLLDTYKNVDNMKPSNTYHLLTHLLTHEESNYWVFKKFSCIDSICWGLVEMYSSSHYIYKYPRLRRKRHVQGNIC